MSGNPPNLGDIQKDLKEFLAQKYGADVQFAQPEQEGSSTDPPAEEAPITEILFNMKPEPKKKLPNKKVISSAKFEAKEQFTKSALENLKTEKERIVNSLKKSGEIKESKRK